LIEIRPQPHFPTARAFYGIAPHLDAARLRQLGREFFGTLSELQSRRGEDVVDFLAGGARANGLSFQADENIVTRPST
jgi:hypothetical protein